MSSYNNLVQRVDVHYAAAELGGASWSRMSRRPFPKEEMGLADFSSSETERHLKQAHAVLARLRQAVQSDR